jgi:hypothetical protein
MTFVPMAENPLKKILNPGLTADNYLDSYLLFEQRQAGISLVFCPEENRFFYNVYCLEIELVKELLSVEFEYLEDALDFLNLEFGQWKVKSYDKKKSGCSTCVAKK